MGSQQVWHARVNSPPAIVIETHDGWRIAIRGDGTQPNQLGGGAGPVVLTYAFAPGLPYPSQKLAESDASLIIARDRDYDP